MSLKLFCQLGGFLIGYSLELLAGVGVLCDKLFYCGLQVRNIVHQVLKAPDEVFHMVDALQSLCSGYSLDTAYTCGYGAFRYNLEQADGAGAGGMGSTAELY